MTNSAISHHQAAERSGPNPWMVDEDEAHAIHQMVPRTFVLLRGFMATAGWGVRGISQPMVSRWTVPPSSTILFFLNTPIRNKSSRILLPADRQHMGKRLMACRRIGKRPF